MNSSLYLVGFMGCGKSTIGYMLGEHINQPLIDLDKVIERQEGRAIPDIFKEDGEAYFRKVETQILRETSNDRPSIVATGGGIISQKSNREFLKKEKTIYLEWQFETLYERIKNDVNRPKVKDYEQLKALYESREAYYKEVATYILACEGQAEYEIIIEIIDKLGGKL